jgi:diphthamide biosynthesis protein 2
MIEPQAAVPGGSLEAYFEIDKSAAAIASKGARRVALQFPDCLLVYATTVKQLLQAAVGADIRFFLLGDTSYGSVHVDEVNAQHVLADLIIHYGAAHVSVTSRLAVQWVLSKLPCNAASVVDCIREHLATLDAPSRLIIALESPYLHVRPAVSAAFAAQPHVVVGEHFLDDLGFARADDHPQASLLSAAAARVCGSIFQSAAAAKSIGEGRGDSSCDDSLDCAANTLVYVGRKSQFRDSLFLRFNKCQHLQLNPDAPPPLRLGPPDQAAGKVMLRRFYVIEALRRASSVGVIVGTLAIDRYGDLLRHVKKLLINAGKKPYVFVVGKINVAKLGNFGDIDAFVYIGAVDHDLLDDRDYPAVIATPFEVECACGHREWTGDYIVDFGELLVAAGDGPPLASDGSPSAGDSAMGPSDRRLLALHSPAAVMLNAKPYRGLEVGSGTVAVELASAGQFGIASAYESEMPTRRPSVGVIVAAHTSCVPAAAKPSDSAPDAFKPSDATPEPAAVPLGDGDVCLGGALFEDELSDISSFSDDERGR